MKEYCSLLQRQIRKCNLNLSEDSNDEIVKLLDLVNEAYFDFEEENMLLHRSIEISSKEFQENIEATHKLEAQLIQNEKMVGIGQLSAGIAHEINNPLGFVKSNVESLNKYLSKIHNMYELSTNMINQSENLDLQGFQSEAHKVLEFHKQNKIDFIFNDLSDLVSETSDGLFRISKIVNSLLSFARRGMDEELEEYDLNKGIRDTIIIANNEIKYYAKVVENLENIPSIMAFSGEINQVILNLILNAAHAIKAKGVNGTIAFHTYCLEDYVYFEIMDDGVGISQTLIKKIFEPFFTTKPVGSGTGLGLCMAYSIIVNRHHGEIMVDSEVGVGTTFKIKLPISQDVKEY